MISEIAEEHGSSSGLERRQNSRAKVGNYPDFYAFADMGCFSIATGITSSGRFTKVSAKYPTDNSCYVECGKAKYFALGQKYVEEVFSQS